MPAVPPAMEMVVWECRICCIATRASVTQQPTTDAGLDQIVIEGDTVTLDGTGSSDPDGQIDSYSWTGPQNNAITNANTATATFAAPAVSANTTYEFTLLITDDDGSQDADIVIKVNPIDLENNPAAVNAIAGQAVTAGDTFEYVAVATGVEGNSLAYFLTAKPNHASINGSGAIA